MTVFSTLLAVIGVDTSGLKKGEQEVTKIEGSITQKLEKTTKASDALGNSFLNLARQLKNAVAAGVGLGAIILGIKAAAMETKSLDDLSRYTGISVESLDAWSGAITKAGGDAATFQNTVRTMNWEMQKTAVYGMSETLPYFQWLGIRLRNAKGEIKSFVDILPELADKFQGMSSTKATIIGQKMGIDWQTVSLLQQGRKEIGALIARQKELGIITQRDADIVRTFNMQWADTAHAFRSLFVDGNSFVLPILEDVGKVLEKVALFFRRHGTLIQGTLIGIGYTALHFLVPILWKLATPWFAMTAGITLAVAALALLYDDIQTFRAGGDSLIGRAIEKWPELAKVIGYIGEVAKNTQIVFDALARGIGGITFNIVNTIQTAMEWIDKIMEKYRLFRRLIGLGGDEPGEEINNGPSPSGFNLMDGMKNKKIVELLGITDKRLAEASSTPLNSLPSNSIVTNNRTAPRTTAIQIGDISINTNATDGPGIASDIGDSLKTHLRQTIANLDDGRLA